MISIISLSYRITIDINFLVHQSQPTNFKNCEIYYVSTVIVIVQAFSGYREYVWSIRTHRERERERERERAVMSRLAISITNSSIKEIAEGLFPVE